MPLQCILISPSSKTFNTVCNNLSAGGIKILSERFLPLNKTLRINIKLASGMATFLAQVAWCSKQPYSDHYVAGLHFIEITTRKKTALTTHIAHEAFS